jgi:anti-anti-sigma factor
VVDPPEFGISVVAANSAATLQPTGEVDMATAAQLRDRLEAVIDASTGDVVVDLVDVTFLDSTGLVVLLAAHQQLEAQARRLVVRNPSRFVNRVLELSGAADVLGVRSATLEGAGE